MSDNDNYLFFLAIYDLRKRMPLIANWYIATNNPNKVMALL